MLPDGPPPASTKNMSILKELIKTENHFSVLSHYIYTINSPVAALLIFFVAFFYKSTFVKLPP
jgi:hypothetical protein